MACAPCHALFTHDVGKHPPPSGESDEGFCLGAGCRFGCTGTDSAVRGWLDRVYAGKVEIGTVGCREGCLETNLLLCVLSEAFITRGGLVFAYHYAGPYIGGEGRWGP